MRGYFHSLFMYIEKQQDKLLFMDNQYSSFSHCAGLESKRPRHGRDDCLRVRMGQGGKKFFPPSPDVPVKQDDFKGTSGNPEGL